MNTVRNVWDLMCQEETLKVAIKNAAKHKLKFKYVKKITQSADFYAKKLRKNLLLGRFNPSLYERKIIRTYGKEREIFKLPFYPDRVIQHAIALVMKERWTKILTDDTYASWPKRGINSKVLKWNMNHKVKRAIASYKLDREIYCLKIDIRKCYPSIDNEILKETNRKYCQDADLLALFDKIISKTKGLPIGNYISQLWINVYLSPIDRFVREVLKAKWYFRYMDDIVIISDSKEELHTWQWRLMNFIFYTLNLELNDKRQIFKVGWNKFERGIDFAGYVYYRTFSRIRKRNKVAFIRKLDKPLALPSYLGMLKFCNSKHLIDVYLNKKGQNMAKKLLDMKLKKVDRPFEGEKMKIETAIDKDITILDFDIINSTKREGTKYLKMQVLYEGKKRFIGGGYQFLIEVLEQIDKSDLPLDTVIRYRRGFYFDGTIDEE